ncbi:MAG TPA: ChbG/HpnK family deacetylase [Terracidiphilus sp.]
MEIPMARAGESSQGAKAGDIGRERRMSEPQATVIVNADDWGAAAATTDRILVCILQGVVSSTSAMVFMEDSERAAELARVHEVDAGLHLNLTQDFTAKDVAPRLRQEHGQLARYLRGRRIATMLPNPLLARSFEYVVKAQLEEFERLYGRKPRRIDGHHHAHLCANVVGQELLPEGTIVRRNFTFAQSEKGWLNRNLRARQDRRLSLRHGIADFFFDIAPMDEVRLKRIAELARGTDVEIECHPQRENEYRFLMDGGLARFGLDVAHGYRLRLPKAGVAKVVEIANPHIAVCICTYKRPAELKRLLHAIERQKTDGRFTFSVVVADNDEARSGEAVAQEAHRTLKTRVTYCAEPRKGIARARNTVMATALNNQPSPDYFALIDDDEFPEPDWLLNLLATCGEYGVDGVLGPVKRYLDAAAPNWLKRTRLYDRAVRPTGMPVTWRGARTGNVLLRRDVIGRDETPFRAELTAGEDQDFFHRKIDEGRRFVWAADAVVYEELPAARWKRMYFVRKSLLHGSHAALQPDCDAKKILKSVVAVPLYTLALPFALAAGQHRFMMLLVKLCDHAGKLMSVVGIRPVHGEYVSE